MELQRTLIDVETAEYRIRGTITLRAVQRVSDALNDSAREFLALTDVTCVSKADGSTSQHPFIAVSRTHVILAMPAETVAQADGAPLAQGADSLVAG